VVDAVSDGTPAGQPGSFASLYADDVRDYPWWHLTEADEARRAGLEAAALEYGRAGYRVIPLWHVDEHGQCCCPKAWECDRAGKHPVERGWKDLATTDPPWWRQPAEGMEQGSWYPLANIAIVPLAPPSVSGKGPYAFIDKHDLMPAPAPAWLLDAIAEGAKQQRGEPSRIAPG
jgi:hypothetical protein